jgi:UDPglucose 6-dehydrogenase
MNKNILIFGAGYVGFSLSVVMARVVNVTVVDIRDDIVQLINKGCSPIQDQGIEEQLKTVLASNRLKSRKYSASLIDDADFIVLALPTNYNEIDGSFDTSALDDVLENIAANDRNKTIIIKSTIPVGYTEQAIQKHKFTECFFSPEFLREGRATYDNLHPSRIIVGSCSPSAKEFVEILDRASHKRNIKKIYTDNKTAEVTKLSANSYLASRVAFFNELDTLALKIGLNVEQLIDGICSDTRIGEGYNNPSFGYGGYCLPKDVKQFQRSMKEFGVKSPLINSIDISNQQRVADIVSFVRSSGAKKIGIYRVQMKQGSDNSRQSTNLTLFYHLQNLPGVSLKIFEPKIEIPKELSQFIITDLNAFGEWAELILANRDAVELQPYQTKVFTRDIYNEN